MRVTLSLILFITLFNIKNVYSNYPEIKFFTVGTEMTDGLIRLIESATTFNITLNIIGLGEKWEGGNMEIGEGGGHKIHLFKNEMEKYKDRDDLVVVFMDA